jgi:hypothetical protein
MNFSELYLFSKSPTPAAEHLQRPFSLGEAVGGVKLTADFYIVPRSSSGATNPLPPYAFVAFTGTTVALP